MIDVVVRGVQDLLPGRPLISALADFISVESIEEGEPIGRRRPWSWWVGCLPPSRPGQSGSSDPHSLAQEPWRLVLLSVSTVIEVSSMMPILIERSPAAWQCGWHESRTSPDGRG